MSKIAILLPSLHGGGAERVMLNLAANFVQQGWQVDLVLVKAEGPYLTQVPPEVNIINLGGKRLLLSLSNLIRYWRQVRPDFLMCGENDVSIVALAIRNLVGVKTKLIITVHNNLSQETRNATKLKKRLTGYFARWLYPSADQIVSVSQGVAKDLAGIIGLPLERIQVIYNPVVTPVMLEQATEQVDHPWFAVDAPPVILGVGRLIEQKDFPTLIQAFALVRKTHRAKLMILGEGKERSNLEALVKELGLESEVMLPGFVDNPYAYMAQASLCVLSSGWEGFGNVLVEAMAVGTPVVSTNCESGPAEILDNGQYGKLVAVGDIPALAQAIVNTLQHPPDSTILRQRSGHFTAQASASQYLQMLSFGVTKKLSVHSA